jgi:hypothetical protein
MLFKLLLLLVVITEISCYLTFFAGNEKYEKFYREALSKLSVKSKYPDDSKIREAGFKHFGDISELIY